MLEYLTFRVEEMFNTVTQTLTEDKPTAELRKNPEE